MKTASSIILLVGILTLVVAPATCSGGLLVHCCAPEEDGHEDDHHDHGCPTDPCNLDTVTGPAQALGGGASVKAVPSTVLPSNIPLLVPSAGPNQGSIVRLLVRSAETARILPLLC